MGKYDIGLIGLATMGSNLALNVESRGFSVCVYNRSPQRTDEFINNPAKDKKIKAVYSLNELVVSLSSPKKIILMVQAGQAVDDMIGALFPLMDSGDIIIDAGNSYYKDTERRYKNLSEKGIYFLGTGISGGEEGALKGPSVMPGGSEQAWNSCKNILKAISAKVSGEDCCSFIGGGGSGHYVKMVHNGIEYGDMQLICESYSLLRYTLGLSCDECAEIFSGWNNGKLESYLIEITAKILKYRDSDGLPLVDKITDSAGQKGTGKWTSQDALDCGAPTTIITEAVFARYISTLKDERIKASSILEPHVAGDSLQDVPFFSVTPDDVRDALYAAKICSYAQGFDLMNRAADQNGWDFDFGKIASLWRGGCIIRARFLDSIKNAFKNNTENLLLNPFFKEELSNCIKPLRRVIAYAAMNGTPAPCLMAALSYYDSYRSKRLPANLLQAQRDFFGAHTYSRIDSDGVFHTDWS